MNYKTRKTIIKELEIRTDKDVLFIATSDSLYKDGSIEYEMELVMDRILPQSRRKEVLLILESGGGVFTPGITIMSMLRNCYEKITVAIYGTAMSTATLMTFAADEVLMASNAKIGPIDVHSSLLACDISNGNFPLGEVTKILKEKKLLKGKNYNLEAIKIALMEMNEVFTKKNIYTIIKKHVGCRAKKTFRELTTKGDHGTPIFFEEAKRLGLKVKKLDSVLESLIRKLVYSFQDEFGVLSDTSPEVYKGKYLKSCEEEERKLREEMQNSDEELDETKEELPEVLGEVEYSQKLALIESADLGYVEVETHIIDRNSLEPVPLDWRWKVEE